MERLQKKSSWLKDESTDIIGFGVSLPQRDKYLFSWWSRESITWLMDELISGQQIQNSLSNDDLLLLRLHYLDSRRLHHGSQP